MGNVPGRPGARGMRGRRRRRLRGGGRRGAQLFIGEAAVHEEEHHRVAPLRFRFSVFSLGHTKTCQQSLQDGTLLAAEPSEASLGCRISFRPSGAEVPVRRIMPREREQEPRCRTIQSQAERRDRGQTEESWLLFEGIDTFLYDLMRKFEKSNSPHDPE